MSEFDCKTALESLLREIDTHRLVIDGAVSDTSVIEDADFALYSLAARVREGMNTGKPLVPPSCFGGGFGAGRK